MGPTTLSARSLRNLAQALNLEWLETNGLGGFAASTVICCNTRRYHGLLVSALRAPGARVVLLSKLEERLEIGELSYELSCNLYRDVMHPRGYAYLESFVTEPWPTWVFRVGNCQLRKELAMCHRENTVVVRYTIEDAPHPVWLLVRPLFAGRYYHHLRRASSGLPTRVTMDQYLLDVTLDEEDTRCVLYFKAADCLTDGLWYYSFRYPVEEERGLDCVEDLYSPGQIRWLLAPGDSGALVASTAVPGHEPDWYLSEEAKRRADMQAAWPQTDVIGRRLLRAADQFVAQRRFEDRWLTTILAGYPWFGEWGRDAMIALPGILISTGRFDEAAQVLELFAHNMHNGLIPNAFFDDGSGACYNSVDATLWMFVAARLHAQAAGPQFVLEKLYPSLRDSINCLMSGTDFNIYADQDGLLCAGDRDTQLTWMDAKVEGKPVTPRWHKPVEVEALWFSALRTMEYFANKAGDMPAATEFAAASRRARAAFRKVFWEPARGYLADCLTTEGLDETLRPNQVLALSLPYKIVDDNIAASSLAAVEQHLLTPYGLRTLPPGSPGYRSIYVGGPPERDAAYHQGTVWPWLMGPYVRAKLLLNKRSKEARRWAREILAPLIKHLDSACLGQISEIFDADAPHPPRGCFAQAWSVAEVLRLWVDYGLGELD